MWIRGKVNGGEENSPWVDRCGGWIGGCDLRKSTVRSCDLWVSRCGTAISGVERRSLVRSCDLWVSQCGTAISGAKAAIFEWWNGVSLARW
nr:hypothetical protein CFP56_47527 [Quercus suber]